MGVHTAISVDEYLHTAFPGVDREYRDGEIIERSLPDYLHGKCQGLLVAFFIALRKRYSLYPCTETRMRLRPGRVLIPDVAVFHRNEPPRVPDTPPLLIIEILSLDDPMTDVRDKLEEYRAWGVPHVWLVDPNSRRLYTCEGALAEVPSLKIAELEVILKPSDIFD